MTEKEYNVTDPMNEVSVDDEAFQGFEDSDSLLWNTEFESLFDTPLHSEPWQEPAVGSDHIDLPPDRVRFATLATLRLIDSDVRVDGVITNLSSDGLACVTAADFDPGTEVEISFQMDLSDEPLNITAEVLWRRYPESGDPCYGLRFLELSQAQDDAIMGFIRERTEGRASEWSMPALPILEGESRKPRGRLAVAGTMGLAAGVALALMMALIPAVDPTDTLGDGEVVTPTVAGMDFQAQAEASKVPVVEEEPETPAIEETPESPELAEVKQTTAKLPVEKLVPESKPMKKTEVAANEEPMKAKPVIVAATDESQAQEQPQSGIVVDGDDGNVRLVLRTDGPVAKHKSFWLQNPRRFVVDVPGRRNAFDRLNYELNHPLAERLRVGQHPDKVRFVVETSEDVLRKARLTPQNDTLIIDLKRR